MAIIGDLYKIDHLLIDKKLNVVFDYLKDAAKKGSIVNKRIFSLPVGSFEKVFLSEDIFALEQVYYTKERNDCFVESHLKHIDFQLHLEGIEQMETIDVDKLVVKSAYDEQNDLITYETVDEMSKIIMGQNSLVIYFPEDAHMGLPQYSNTKSLVYKTVVKLPVGKY
ncbi:MAG: YhcH/YjgK/YiaL family protein [Reichenbachiella sp.]